MSSTPLTTQPEKLKLFIDADVLFAASASGSEYGASLVVLRLGEITLLDIITSEQVITEVERNLTKKIPKALPAFRLICQRSLSIVENPPQAEISKYNEYADPKDLPILTSALEEACAFLLTFNTRHFHPPSDLISVLRPGEFIKEVRHILTNMN